MLLIIFNFKERGFNFLNINRASCYEKPEVAALNFRNQLRICLKTEITKNNGVERPVAGPSGCLLTTPINSVPTTQKTLRTSIKDQLAKAIEWKYKSQ
jgi:hypothetical protein